MSSPSEHTTFQFNELNELNNTLNVLNRLGINPADAIYKRIYEARGAALAKLGLAAPRTTTLLQKLIGLSPGTITLFRDAELGYLVEAVPEPGAREIRRYVSEEVAVQILTGGLTHELEAELFAPNEPYEA